MSRLEELTSRFEAADAADQAASAGDASTQNTSGAGEDAGAQTPENAGDAGSQAEGEAAQGEGEGAGDGKDAPAGAADEPPAWFSKSLQREQIERANLAKQIEALTTRIEARGGSATPAEAKQLQTAAASLEQSNQRLAGIKAKLGKDFDAFEKSGEVLGDLAGVAEELSTRLAALEQENQKLRERVEAGDARSQAQVQEQRFWQQFAADHPGIDGRDLWNKSLQEASGKGYKGEALQGAADVIWQLKVDAAAEAAKAGKQAPQAATGSPAPKANLPTAPARSAPVTPGGARVVQQGAGARTPAASKSAEQRIEAGEVDFGFAGRYERFK